MSVEGLVQLDRFLLAQAAVYDDVLAELTAGKKRSHWMWFIFPQLRGLGRSSTAYHFGIQGMVEANAYYANPVLGNRLTHCTAAVCAHHDKTIHEIFGSPDDLKFRSCMTLFNAVVGPPDNVFKKALDMFYEGRSDEGTLAHLRGR